MSIHRFAVARPPLLTIGSDEAHHDRDTAHRPLRDVRRLLDVAHRPNHPPSVEQMFQMRLGNARE